MTATTALRTPHDVRTLDRWVAAILMPIGPAAVAVIRFVIPGEPVGDTVAANPNAQRLVLGLGVIAVLTLLPGAFAAVRLVRPHMPRLSVWIAGTLITGYLGMTALMGTDTVAMAGTDLGMDPAVVTQLSAAIFELPSFNILMSLFILGHIIGVLLLGIAAYKAALMPRTVAVLLAASQFIHFTAVMTANPWLDLLGWGLTALGMGFLSMVLLRTSNDDWEVPPRPRGRGQQASRGP